MSFFNRVNVALEELNEGALESEVETGSVEDQELDMVDTADEAGLAEAESEITTDNESIDEAVEVSEELQEQAETNEEALENPEEITEEQVEVAEECLKMNLARLGFVDMYKEANGQFKLAHESYSSPAERLQVAQEGIKETISKIIEMIRNIFRKIILWFKKMYAKLIVMFNRNLSRAKKVKELLSKRVDGANPVDSDEFAALCVDNPLVGYWLANRADRLTLDKDVATIENIKSTVDTINTAISGGNAAKITWKGAAGNDRVDIKALGGEVDKLGEKEGILIVTNPTTQKPKCLYILNQVKQNEKDNSLLDIELELQYQKIDLDQDTWHAELKKVGKSINKSWISGKLNDIIKSAGKIKKFADSAFKTIESGGKMANAFEALNKKFEKSQQGEMSSVAYTKAANIGRKLAGQVAVDVVIGGIRGQGVAISILAACTKQLDNKKK